MAHCSKGAPFSSASVHIIWGKEWRGKEVTHHCDNITVVEVLNSGYSKDKNMMHMLRSLFFISEHHQFLVEAVHLLGKLNKAVDAISQNNMSHFLQVLPGAQQHPIPIPGQALRMLVEDQPDWTSRRQSCSPPLPGRPSTIYTKGLHGREKEILRLL